MNTAIFERFRQGCDAFFEKKNTFFKDLKEELNTNLAKKKELVEKAESLMESTDWRSTGDILINLQKQWKEIGTVPRKYSEDLWKRFTTACDHFFEARQAATADVRNEEKANKEQKLGIIAQLKELAETEGENVIQQVKELQQKYKDDKRKLQQEQMRLYAEAKVNPLSSCLPMLIQLPIFIALFMVLRTSVELRHESFLWIRDLSEPENLFRDTLGFGLNLLPIGMAVTMTLQSRLTPSAGDPSQQRMMTILMPVLMLVMCYPFPSALGLYWVVSQAIAIAAIWRARRKGKPASFTQADGTEVTPPARETRQMRRERERNAEKQA